MTGLQAQQLRPGRWAVQPMHTIGTCGWITTQGVSKPWTVVYVNAGSEREAINKALSELAKGKP